MVVIYHLLQEVLSFYNASFLHLGEKIVGIELKQIIVGYPYCSSAALSHAPMDQSKVIYSC